MNSYLSTTLELKEFDSPLEVTDAINVSGVRATCSADAIFISADLDNSNGFIENLAEFIAQKLKVGHCDVVLSVKCGSILLDYDLIICDNTVYIKKAEEYIF